MPHFQYTAKDAQGRSLTGTVEQPDQGAVIALLHSKNLTVISLTQVKATQIKSAKLKLEVLVVSFRQLATMIDSGISLVQALSILAGDKLENKNLSDIMQKIKEDIENGTSFYDAIAKYPQVFSEFSANMIRAGETSGKLDEILERLATYLEKTSALQNKVRSSLIYPAVVISMALLITVFLLIKVVPTFKDIFDTLGGTLPMPTQVLINISDLIKNYFLIDVLVIAGIVILFKKYISTDKGRYQFDRFLLTVPIFGVLIRKVAIAKFSRTLATLVRSGVPILNALDIVGKTSGNKIVEENIKNACIAIKEGEPIAGPLSRGNVFPSMVVRMISVGEQTGQLEKMLNKISDFYEEQVDTAVSGLTSLIEPLVIAFLGIIVGGIVIALFLPVFKMTQMVG